MEKNVYGTLKNCLLFNQLKYIKEELKKKNYNIPSDIPKEYYLKIFEHFKTNGLDYRNRLMDITRWPFFTMQREKNK